MIRVTIELVSAVNASRNQVLGVATISNDGKTSSASGGVFGSYDVTLSKWAPKTNQVWKRGRVEDFDREERGSWDLLFLALRNIVGSRNP